VHANILAPPHPHFIQMPVSRPESGRSCIGLLGVFILPLSAIV